MVLRKIKQHGLGENNMMEVIIIKWTARSILFKTDAFKHVTHFLNTQWTQKPYLTGLVISLSEGRGVTRARGAWRSYLARRVRLSGISNYMYSSTALYHRWHRVNSTEECPNHVTLNRHNTYVLRSNSNAKYVELRNL